MRKQTKPFTVEIKPSRKPKSGNQKPSIWGTLDLRATEELQVITMPDEAPTAVEDSGRS